MFYAKKRPLTVLADTYRHKIWQAFSGWLILCTIQKKNQLKRTVSFSNTLIERFWKRKMFCLNSLTRILFLFMLLNKLIVKAETECIMIYLVMIVKNKSLVIVSTHWYKLKLFAQILTSFSLMWTRVHFMGPITRLLLLLFVFFLDWYVLPRLYHTEFSPISWKANCALWTGRHIWKMIGRTSARLLAWNSHRTM